MNAAYSPDRLARPPEPQEIAAVEANARAEIEALFTQALRKVPAARLTVPGIRHEGTKSTKEIAVPMEEVIGDAIQDTSPLLALTAALEGSDCPLVQAVRVAIAARWSYWHAAELAERRAQA